MPYLDVTGGHRIYYEIHGAADGRPAVLLHGGPGGGFRPSALKAFDLTRWRVVAFDQRGCGRSTPRLGLTKNTTWDLVEDVEALRHLVFGEATACTVFGGSWGSTLALAYWSRYPAAVAALVLRGVCLMEPWEQRWLYTEDGAARVAPEEWRKFSKAGRLRRRTTAAATTRRFRSLFRSRTHRVRRSAVDAWYRWEAQLSQLRPPTKDKSTPKEREELAVLEAHYFHRNAWLRPGQLLAAARRIPRSVPVYIVQGRYDLVCPAASAVAVARAVPHSHLQIVDDAGHSSGEPGIAAGLRAATDALVRA